MLNFISIIVENEDEARRKQLNNQPTYVNGLELTEELIETGCRGVSDRVLVLEFNLSEKMFGREIKKLLNYLLQERAATRKRGPICFSIYSVE